MGCFCSKYLDEDPAQPPRSKNFKKPVWKSTPPWSQSELQVCIGFGHLYLLFAVPRHTHMQPSSTIDMCMLQSKREEFWDTAPHYGGDQGKLMRQSLLGTETGKLLIPLVVCACPSYAALSGRHTINNQRTERLCCGLLSDLAGVESRRRG